MLGCVDPVGEAGGDIARAAALNAGFARAVPGIQVSRFCASGLDAVNLAAAQVMAGQNQMTIGGGVESMSRIGLGASGGAWLADPRWCSRPITFPRASRRISSPPNMASHAAMSTAMRCKASGGRRSRVGARYFLGSLVPVVDQNGLTLLDRDEHMRPDTTMQSLGALKPSFAEMGETYGFDQVAIQRYPEVEAIEHVHHAGNSSGIVDGAAAVLLGSAEAASAAACGRAPGSAPLPISARSPRSC